MGIILSDLGDAYLSALNKGKDASGSKSPDRLGPWTGRDVQTARTTLGEAGEGRADVLPLAESLADPLVPAGVEDTIARQATAQWAERTDDLLRQARNHKTTPLVVLAALFAIVIQRSRGITTVNLGIPNANRPELATHQEVGLFADLSVLTLNIDERESLSDVIRQAKDRWLQVLSTQHIPFDSLVRQSHEPLDSAIVPVVDAVISPAYVPALKLAGLTVMHEVEEFPVAKYPVLCNFPTDAQGDRWSVVVPSRAMDRAPEHWLHELGRAMDTLLGNSNCPMRSLPRVLKSEEQRVIMAEQGQPYTGSSESRV